MMFVDLKDNFFIKSVIKLVKTTTIKTTDSFVMSCLSELASHGQFTMIFIFFRTSSVSSRLHVGVEPDDVVL